MSWAWVALLPSPDPPAIPVPAIVAIHFLQQRRWNGIIGNGNPQIHIGPRVRSIIDQATF